MRKDPLTGDQDMHTLLTTTAAIKTGAASTRLNRLTALRIHRLLWRRPQRHWPMLRDIPPSTASNHGAILSNLIESISGAGTHNDVGVWG